MEGGTGKGWGDRLRALVIAALHTIVLSSSLRRRASLGSLKRGCRAQTMLAWKEWRLRMETSTQEALSASAERLREDAGFLDRALASVSRLAEQVRDMALAERQQMDLEMTQHARRLERHRRVSALKEVRQCWRDAVDLVRQCWRDVPEKVRCSCASACVFFSSRTARSCCSIRRASEAALPSPTHPTPQRPYPSQLRPTCPFPPLTLPTSSHPLSFTATLNLFSFTTTLIPSPSTPPVPFHPFSPLPLPSPLLPFHPARRVSPPSRGTTTRGRPCCARRPPA